MTKRKKSNKQRTERVETRKINIWVMLRDVLIASINKGQLPIAIVGLFILILAIKMPSEQAGKLISELLDLAIKGKLLGYVLFVGAVFGWLIHTKRQRRTITKEIRRIGDEKTKLQEKLAPKLIESSEV